MRTDPRPLRILLTVIAGIIVGGAAGAGVGAGFYPPSIGVPLAIAAGALTGVGVWRARRGPQAAK